MIDYPLSALGSLAPSELPGDGAHSNSRTRIVKGVELSPRLIAEIHRMCGTPIEWLTAGELEDAVIGYAVDCTLADDNEGVTFRDKLTLTKAEIIAREREKKKNNFFNSHENELTDL